MFIESPCINPKSCTSRVGRVNPFEFKLLKIDGNPGGIVEYSFSAGISEQIKDYSAAI